MTDLDPLLREAMVRLEGPVDLHPSISDVHRRARRHNRRRMAATAGALACTGVAAAALIIRRESVDPATSAAPDGATTTLSPTTLDFGPTTSFFLEGTPSQTFIVDTQMMWAALQNASDDPSGAGLIEPIDVNEGEMPTAEMFGCSTAECGSMFNYIVWHEIANRLGFRDVHAMQSFNPQVDFSQLPHPGDVLQSSIYDAVGEGTPPQTSTTTTTLPPNSCDPSVSTPTVVVANASSVNGTAKWWKEMLAGNVPGAEFADPVNAIAPEGRSRVLALDGYQCQASMIAGFTTAVEVEPVTIETLQSLVAGTLPPGTAIVVLVGNDQMSVLTTGATTTTMVGPGNP